VLTPYVLTSILQPGSIKACNWEFIELHTRLAHPAVARTTLDVITLAPNPKACNPDALGPSPAG
jgi:hypothetical protein